MKALLKRLLGVTLALSCITLTKAQVSNSQSKIKDYKLKHDMLLRLKQNHHTETLGRNFGLKINPYWEDVNAPHVINNSHVREVKLPTLNTIWASVDYDTAAYIANSFLRSADAGKTWRLDSVDAPYGYGISGIAAIDANTCYAAMFNAFPIGGGVFKTTDGGNIWKQLEPRKLFAGEYSFPDIIHFFDAQHGVTIGDDDQIDSSRLEIYTTSDAGKTWQRVPDQNIPPTQGYAFSSNFNSYTFFQNRLWVTAGDTYGNSYIYRSDDFGQHWQQFPLLVSFNDFAFADKQNGLGVAFDDNGAPLEVETHDGGKIWTNKNFTGNPMGLFITVIPFTHTFVSTIPHFAPVAGSSYSNDYGATWNIIDSSSNFNPFALAFLNPSVGWCGRADSPDPNGGMYKWKYKFSLDNNAITTVDANTADKDLSVAKSKIPLTTYPNPVSNSTNISFSLTGLQQVSISVFDESGRLIKIITKAQLEAGTYQLSWNADDKNGSRVATGIYYLKFNAGSYSETKKLTVIK